MWSGIKGLTLPIRNLILNIIMIPIGITLGTLEVGLLISAMVTAAYYYSSAEPNKEEKDDNRRSSPLDENHCESCLCKNPELVSVLLGEADETAGSDGDVSDDEESNFTSITWSSYPTKLMRNTPEILERECLSRKVNSNFVLPLTPKYLDQCKDPSFLEEELSRIEEEYLKERNKLDKEKETLLNRCKAQNKSGIDQQAVALRRTGSAQKVDHIDTIDHCKGCICNNPELVTSLRDQRKNKRLINSKPHFDYGTNYDTKSIAKERLALFDSSTALEISNTSPRTLSGLSFTREYLEKCRDQTFLAEELKLIKEERQGERDGLKERKESLQKDRMRYSEVLKTF